MIVASLAAVMFNIVRNRVLDDVGVPFGILFSGFSFTRLSYYWSPAFWSIIEWKSKITAKVLVIVLLIVSGILALVVGPASAVVMLPRLNVWLRGDFEILANVWTGLDGHRRCCLAQWYSR